MKEFIEKLIGRLEEYPTYSFGVSLLNTKEYIKVSDLKEIVNELAEEYKADKVNQLAMMYAQNMHMYGVDVTKAWETATSQSTALNEAYLRGLHDERKYQHTQMKNNNGWIPCSERLPKDEELSQRKEVIVQNRYGEIFTAEYTYNSTHTHKDFFRNHYIVPYVTAWQPLPGKYIPKGEQ